MQVSNGGIDIADSVLAFMYRHRLLGRYELYKLLRRHSLTHSIRARTKHGILLNLDPESAMDGPVVVDGYYEEEVLSAVLDNLRTGDVFWDIGANIGLHAITVRRLRPDVRVVCFEPSPFAFVNLSDNVTLSGEEIDLLNIALSSDAGYSRLSILIQGNSGLTSLKPWPGVNYTNQLLCRCETAKSVIQSARIPAPNVVKIDVEGFELEVLGGFGELLSDPSLRAVIFESEDGLVQNTTHPVMRLLWAAGFGSVKPIPAEPNATRITNFVAARV